MTAYADLVERARNCVMATYGPAPLALVRGSGSTVWDVEGRSYTDFVAGIAVCALGHAHPAVVEAVARQLGLLGHVSNLFLTAPAVELAERLGQLAGAPARTFFANSGAEANEAALKLARRRGRAIDPGKTQVVAAEGSFHGRTLGALSITGQPAKREPFQPLPGDVTFVAYGDEDALRAAVGPRTAAVFLEPVQGESGVHVPPPGYLAAARDLAHHNDALLVLDEVQTGVGRTGAWFAHQHEGVLPDVMTLAKGLGGGIPIGACMAFGDAGDVLAPGDHGSTFGGNPVACAAALAVLETLASTNLVGRAAVAGRRLATAITGLEHPSVTGVRGLGLMRAIGLQGCSAKAVEQSLREVGYLVNAIGEDTLRLVPPLVITDEELDAFVGALPAALDVGRARP